MGKPKSRTTSRKTGMRRSHLVLRLARRVNARSPVKVRVGTKKIGQPAKK